MRTPHKPYKTYPWWLLMISLWTASGHSHDPHHWQPTTEVMPGKSIHLDKTALATKPSRHPSNPELVTRLQQLHRSGAIAQTQQPNQHIDDWLSALYRSWGGLPSSLMQAHRQLQPFYHWLNARATPKQDPANTAATSAPQYDWETDLTGEPMFDLALASHFCDYQDGQTYHLLKSYRRHAPTFTELNQLYLSRQVAWFYLSVKHLYQAHHEHDQVGLFGRRAFDKQLQRLSHRMWQPHVASRSLQSSAEHQYHALALLKKLCSNMALKEFNHAQCVLKNTHLT